MQASFGFRSRAIGRCVEQPSQLGIAVPLRISAKSIYEISAVDPTALQCTVGKA
jgi:hypothetical protein